MIELELHYYFYNFFLRYSIYQLNNLINDLNNVIERSFVCEVCEKLCVTDGRNFKAYEEFMMKLREKKGDVVIIVCDDCKDKVEECLYTHTEDEIEKIFSEEFILH